MAVVVMHSGTLNGDEAVYASKARSLVTAVPSSGWAVYRPPGMAVLGILTAPLGFSDASLRTLSLLLGLGSVLIAWALARSIFGPWAALLTLVAVAGSPVVLSELRAFHNDLPTVGLLLLLMLLVWNEFERRPRPSRLLLAAGPIAAAAFYLRFGAAPAIAGIALTAVLLWRGRMRENSHLVAVTVAIGVVLLTPYLFDSVASTGSPFGIVSRGVGVANRSSPLSALVQYARWLPVRLMGTGIVLVVAGAISLAAVLRPTRRHSLTAGQVRGFAWLLVPAGVASVILVLVSHAERRYMLFPVILVLIAGSGAVVAAVGPWFSRGSARRQRVALVGLALVAAVQVAAVGYLVRGQDIAVERLAAGSRWAVDAGRSIAADAAGPCMVMTTFPPAIGWSSRCEAVPFATDPSTVFARAAGRPTYLVFSPLDAGRVDRAILERYRALPGASLLPGVGASDPDVEVLRISR
jgi:4-amino-4-deoxy-L-arabinose transferase-like glycosyltransferase